MDYLESEILNIGRVIIEYNLEILCTTRTPY